MIDGNNAKQQTERRENNVRKRKKSIRDCYQRNCPDMALSGLFVGMTRFYDIVKGWERDVLAEQIANAFDNMVGTESDALIGPNGELLQIDTGIIPFEEFTDLIFNSMKNQFSK